jgi:hypothetical protein
MAIAVAVAFAVRDLIGYRDLFQVANVPYSGYDHLNGFVRLLELALAATLWLKCGDRPAARTLAGALTGLSLNNNWWFYSRDNPLLWPSVAINYVGIGYGVMQFMRFSATYTPNDWRGLRARIGSFAPFVGSWVALFGTLWWISALIDQEPYHAFNRLFWAGWDAANVMVILASCVGLAAATNDDERRRMAWVAASFSIAAAGTAVHGFDRAIQGDTDWANYVDAVAQLALPLGLGFSILRLRLLDREFALTGGIVYGSLTLLLSCGEVIFERIARLLVPDRAHVAAAAAEFGLSLVVVVSFKSFEKWTDAKLSSLGETNADRRAEALRTFAREEVFSFGDAAALEDRLLRVLERYAGVAAVALYRRIAGAFRRVLSTFDRLPANVGGHDPGIKLLSDEMRPVQLPATGHLPESSTAFPMLAHGSLVGFALCTWKDSTLSPSLQRETADAVHAAGIALERLRHAKANRRGYATARPG